MPFSTLLELSQRGKGSSDGEKTCFPLLFDFFGVGCGASLDMAEGEGGVDIWVVLPHYLLLLLLLLLRGER